MAKIHMILQGKGGVGKSFVAATMAQYLQDEGEAPLCIDTDPVNSTFAGYSAFDVKRIELMDGTEIDPRRFDELIEMVAPLGPDDLVVIDNGAASFVPLADYLVTCDVPKMLKDMGHEVVLHSVITGGQAQNDTMHGLASLLDGFPSVASVVWLNPYFGQVEIKGKRFRDMPIYTEYKERIRAVVDLPEFSSKLIGRDVEELLKSRRTFREGVEDASLPIMERQRLKQAQREIYNSVATAGLL